MFQVQHSQSLTSLRNSRDDLNCFFKTHNLKCQFRVQTFSEEPQNPLSICVNINQVYSKFLPTTFRHNTNLILSSPSPNIVFISNKNTLQTHMHPHRGKSWLLKKTGRQFASLTLLTISNLTSYDNNTAAINVPTLLQLTFPAWINQKHMAHGSCLFFHLFLFTNGFSCSSLGSSKSIDCLHIT